MDKSLDEIKTYVADKYLGTAGIHAVGINQADNAINVYIEGEADERDQILRQLEEEAAPYKIVPIKSDRASIT